MSNEYQRQLRERLEGLPYADAPAPWRLVGGCGVGGLTEVGFVEGADDLLVVSHQGRGLFDGQTGERLARDPEEFFANDDRTGLTAPGIGRQQDAIVRMAGLCGGGLATGTSDGWSLHVVQLPWPKHDIFLSSNYAGLTGELANITRLGTDQPCEFRSAGFSSTGRTFVVATSCEVLIYGRDSA
ncbi:hypothetical protein AB1L30_05210 [Bremerella sp. JC817]|uniref:hypothetical protein n=1 Tax=Bremerella sp. JC817 TaxID=3231756 RepID=UPI003459C591